MDNCPLCRPAQPETLLWQDAQLRVILANEPDYPALCRVIWHEHTRDMSDLPPIQQQHLMHAVFAVEQALRQLLQPEKINLASLGNLVPHLHWHIIPRVHDDRHFPQSIWSTPQREPEDCRRMAVDSERLRAALNAAFST